ncbi:hypothetical protein IWQ57_005079 [Coemansia nantahalensis]|uniref:Uncharacterized protein n=2 Tax=Coemansia TaxID=4863 RepID=A0ACC1KT02_9FUNG|nr:hypothetical protein IWQ57_005079 [Coemansia nantahalensis]KAJ2794522.1 hypothetical protein H4R21_005470 [Coemansia helicoidea]
MRYGDFATLCERAPLPGCRLFADAVLPSCYLNTYGSNSGVFVNLPDFVISILAFFFVGHLAFRAHRKVDAVGFQIMSDGSLKSMLSLLGSTTVILVVMGYICADTAFGISSGLKPKPSDMWNSPGVFTIYLVLPLVAILIFAVLQSIVVFRFLSARLPLVWLASAFLCFAAGQVILFAASKKMCNGTDHRIDGAFFATLLDTAAVSSVYGFWSAITVDDGAAYGEEEYKF